MKTRTEKSVRLLVAVVTSLTAGASHSGVLQDIGATADKAIGSPTYTVVIPPGTLLNVGGRATVVSGGDLCPRDPVPPSKYVWFMGGHPVDGHECVVIGPDTKDVPVALHSSAGVRTSEIWTVDRQEHNGIAVLGLKRPNGDYVADAK